MNLQTVETQIKEAKKAMELEKKHHEEKMMELQKRMDEAKRQKALLLADVDTDCILRAEKIVYLRVNRRGFFDKSCVEDAIQDILEGTPHMRDKYFGSKNYDRWTHQRSDHKYFYGPEHGVIICSIGLEDEYRNGLTEDQSRDCLYYLNLLLDVGKRESLVERKLINK